MHSFLCVVVGFSPVTWIPFTETRTLYSLMDSVWMLSPSITLSYPTSHITEISGVLTRFEKSPTLILHCEWELSGCKTTTFHLTWQMLDYLCLISHDIAEGKTSYSSLRTALRRKNVKAGISSLILCIRWTSHSNLIIILSSSAPGIEWTGEW